MNVLDNFNVEYDTEPWKSNIIAHTDSDNVVCIYQSDQKWFVGIDLDRFTKPVEKYELGDAKYKGVDGSIEYRDIYRLTSGDNSVFVNREITDKFLETVGAEMEDIVLRDEPEFFPVMIEIPDSEWNGMIAPLKLENVMWVEE